MAEHAQSYPLSLALLLGTPDDKARFVANLRADFRVYVDTKRAAHLDPFLRAWVHKHPFGQ
eukprot:2955915-Alexandrium_andersonii.AAC.1